MASRVVSVDLTANPAAFIAGFGRAGAAAEALDAKTLGLHKNLKTLGGAFIGYEIIKGLGDATKAAANFQTQIVRLQTDANETGANLKKVSSGVLDLAGATGNTTTALNAGIYKIESAGIHGADALKVLRSAAEGAKVGQADLTTVADALTTAMTDYHLPASAANAVTDQLIATVSRGKTTLEDLSASLATVAPAGAQAGIGLDQVLGAMATMTAQGTPASKAATYLRQTIIALADPLPKAQAEMEGLGLSALDVSKNLGSRGLTGTLTDLTDAIHSKLGPSGTVVLDTFSKSAGSAQDFAKAMGALPTKQQTVVASLADLVGGAKSLQAILELTGGSAATFAQNAADIGAAGKNAGKDVTDWGVTQGTLNQKLAEARGSLEKIQIVLGQDLLPVATKIAGWAGDFATTLGQFPGLVEAVTYTFVGAGSLLVGLKLVNGAFSVWQTAMANSAKLRGINTAAMVAEGAAAKAAAVNVAALDVAEASGGLRGAGAAALGGRVLADGSILGGTAVAGGAETAAVAGVSWAAVGAAMAGPIVAALGGEYVAFHLDQSQYTADQRLDTSGKGPNFNNPANAGAVAPGAIGGGYSLGGGLTQKEWDAVYADVRDNRGGNTGPDAAARIAAESGRTQDFQGVVGGRAGIGAMRYDQRVANAARLPSNVNADGSYKLHAGPDAAARDAASNEAYLMDITGQNAARAKLLAASESILVAAFHKAGDGAAGLALGLANLSDNAITASRAQDGFQQQLNNLAASVDKHSKSLTGESNAAIQNRGLLDELAQANEQAAEAVYKHTGSMDKAKSTLIANATALEQNAAKAFGSKKAADEFLKSIGALPAQVAAAFVGIHDIGLAAGSDLGAGLIAGIEGQIPHATVAGKLLVDSTVKQMRLAADSHSPSKVTHKVGKDMGDGLVGGLSESEKKAAAAAKKLASQALAALKFEVRTGANEALHALDAGISALKKKIGLEQSALGNARGNKTSAMAGAKGDITGVADLSAILGTTSTTDNWDGTSTTTTAAPTGAQVRAGLDQDAQLAQTFVSHVKQLQQMHYSKTLIDQILGMGPVAGDAFAVAILSLGAGGVAGINTDFRTIDQAGSAAAAIAGKPFDKQIDRLVHEVQANTKELEKQNKTAATLKLEIHDLSAPNLTESQLRQVEAFIDKLLGRKVGLKGRSG